jgi:hypothetical protein
MGVTTPAERLTRGGVGALFTLGAASSRSPQYQPSGCRSGNRPSRALLCKLNRVPGTPAPEDRPATRSSLRRRDRSSGAARPRRAGCCPVSAGKSEWPHACARSAVKQHNNRSGRAKKFEIFYGLERRPSPELPVVDLRSADWFAALDSLLSRPGKPGVYALLNGSRARTLQIRRASGRAPPSARLGLSVPASPSIADLATADTTSRRTASELNDGYSYYRRLPTRRYRVRGDGISGGPAKTS